jgi:hypothetical protein
MSSSRSWLLPVKINSGGGRFLYFGELRTSGPPRQLVLAVIFIVVAAVMAFIGQGVARTFVKFPPLQAYKLDLIGSVLGIIGFSVLSFLRAPPLAWGAVAVVVMLGLEAPKVTLTGALQVGAPRDLIVLALETFSRNSGRRTTRSTPARRSRSPARCSWTSTGSPTRRTFPPWAPRATRTPSTTSPTTASKVTSSTTCS